MYHPMHVGLFNTIEIINLIILDTQVHLPRVMFVYQGHWIKATRAKSARTRSFASDEKAMLLSVFDVAEI